MFDLQERRQQTGLPVVGVQDIDFQFEQADAFLKQVFPDESGTPSPAYNQVFSLLKPESAC